MLNQISGICLTLSILVLLVGCEPDPKSKINRNIDAQAPKHPAMQASNLGSSSSPSGHQNRGLPAGHPPINTNNQGTQANSTSTQDTSPTKSSTENSKATPSEGGRETVGPVSFVVPKGVIKEKPTGSMRIGQFRLPRVEGDSADALMTVIMAGGSVVDNINRWRGQFVENPKGSEKTLTFAGGKATVLVASGTFKGMGGGPFAPKSNGGGKTNYGLWGAAVESSKFGGRHLFLKATGPQKTIERWAPELDRLTESIELK